MSKPKPQTSPKSKSNKKKGSPSGKPAGSKSASATSSAAVLDAGQAPGPRMQQILQAEIAPWKRDNFNDEEAQLRELKRIPVRNVYDSEEARRRLLGRANAAGKRRFSRSKGTAASRS